MHPAKLEAPWNGLADPAITLGELCRDAFIICVSAHKPPKAPICFGRHTPRSFTTHAL